MEHRYTLAPYTRTADWLICPNCNLGLVPRAMSGRNHQHG